MLRPAIAPIPRRAQTGLGIRRVEFEQLLVAPGAIEQGLLGLAKSEPVVQVPGPPCFSALCVLPPVWF